MKKPFPIPHFPSFRTLLILHILISLSSSSLPVDFVIQPSTCSSNADCTYYRYSKCNGSNQCVQCSVPADCAQFSVAGEEVECTTALTSPSYKYCVIPCSTSNKEPCRKMRGRCSLGVCRQCSSDTHCQGEGYPGTAANYWCDEASVPGLGICSSCLEAGCPGTSICQNFKCIECSSHGDCGTAKPYCEEKFEGNVCRACFEDNHCNVPALSRCSGFSCVKCTGDEYCGHISGKPKCESTKGCVECYHHDHCTGVNDYCSANNQCVQCTENSHCGSGHCVGNICVECELDVHCPSPSNPKCTSGVCGPCSSPTTVCSDNFSGKPVCSSSGVCVECDTPSDCSNPSQPECSSSSKTCQPCSGSTFCSSLGINLNQCATTGSNVGKCVQCIADGNCSGSLSKCLETTTNTCVECIDHADCTDPQKPQCSGNTCQSCPDSPFCLGLPGPLDKCALTGPNNGACVECTDHSHCPIATPVCSNTLNTCVECSDHTHCQDPTKPRCSGNTCQPCSDSTFCSSLDITLPQCSQSGPNIGKCVECTDNIQCSSGSLNHCSNTLNTCVECGANNDCLDPMKPRCIGNTCLPCSNSVFCSSIPSAPDQCALTGPNTGACVDCIDNTHCSGTTPICSLTSNTCVQCADHSHCTNPSAPFCGSANTCQACPDHTFCNTKYPGDLPYCLTGTCVECTAPAHCPGSSCSSTNTCVECTTNSECLTPQLPLCSSNTCQSCSTSPGICAARFSTTKPVCLSTNGECVECETSSHCSSQCELTSHTCVECTAHSHCLDPTKPFCGASHTCQPCPDSTFCSSLPSAPDQCALTGPNTGICVECTDNTHCSGTTPACSLTSNTCVECTGHPHCTDPSAPLCGSGNTCQACPNSPFCAGKYPGNLPYCVTGTCVKCMAPADCSAPTSYCSAINTCVQCTVNGECPTAQLPLCSSSNTCQSCSTSPGVCTARFSTTKPVCLSTNGECVECETSSQCTYSSLKPQCELTSHICVECTAQSHCLDPTKPFCGAIHTCQPCPDSTFCSSLPSAPDQCALTGPNTGKCVECTGNTHCSGTTPVCSLTSNTCVECTDSAHCTDPSAPLCGSGNTCQACPDHTFCNTKYPGDLPFCVTGTCVECMAPGDCSAPTAYCSSENACVECTSHSHCPTHQLPLCSSSNTCQSCSTSPGICAARFSTTKPVCLSTNGECVECETSSHCTSSSSKPQCELTGHTCVECIAHSHCLDLTKPFCGASYACQPCPDSTFCSSLPSAPDQCALTGPNTGKCVECTGNGHCPTATSVCSLTSNICVECTNHPHCTDPSAPFCGSTNACQACPDHTFCNTKYPGDLPYCVTGVCVECTAPGHCSAPTPYCSSSNICVECTGDSQCPSPLLAKCWSDNCQSCTGFPNICSSRFSDKPICLSGECVECTNYNHCLDPTKPFCGANNLCQSCSGTSITFCSTKYPGTLPYCETTGACVECLQSPDCLDPSKPNCISNICQATIYQPQCSPSYNIQIKQRPTRLNRFDLHFPSDLASKIDIESTLALSLLNIPQSDYTYILTKLTSTHYQAIFTSQITIPPTKLRLQLPCPAQPGFIFGDILIETPIQSIPLIDPDLEETIDTIGSITTITANVIAGASGSMILAGANPALMWALIGLLQAFYYMIFINVQYPVNVQAFFGLFSMGNLPFIPNPIEWFFPEIDNVDLQAPSKFLENDVDGLFLQTAGNMLLTWFLVLVGFLVSKFILKFTRNMPRLLNRAAFKMVKMFEWSGVIRTFMTSYTQLSLAAFLQIRVLNFDRQLYGVSSLSGIAFALFAFVFPPVLVLLIHKFSKYPKILNTTFSTLTDEFKYDKQKLAPIYFNAFFVIRRLILVLALIFLHDYPYLEVVILILNCLIWLFLLLKYFPYEKKINNIVNIISEFLFVVIHVIILLFAHDDHKDWLTDQKKLDLGWIIISCCGVILGLTLIVACIEQYFVVKDLIQLLKTFLTEKKSTSQGIKKKSSPQITEKRSTQNTMLNSRNTSTDDLDNSMTLMPFVPLQNISQHRRRIVRPPRKTIGTSKSPSSMTQGDNRSLITPHNNRRQIIHNHIRDIIMSGNKIGSRTHNLQTKKM